MEAVALPDVGARLPAKLDLARGALAEARDDFERLQIRDMAQAISMAAEILKRREVQVEASVDETNVKLTREALREAEAS